MNFDSEDIKVNESAVEKMVRMRKESLFSLQQTLIELNGICMCLLHVRPWNVHLEYFLSDKIYSAYSSLLCFTETNINESPAEHNVEILGDCKEFPTIHNMGWLFF